MVRDIMGTKSAGVGNLSIHHMVLRIITKTCISHNKKLFHELWLTKLGVERMLAIDSKKAEQTLTSLCTTFLN